MGFLNKAFRKIKEQKQTGQMPRRGGGFSSRLRGRKPGMISDMRFRGEMPRGGGFGNLGEAIRRMQEQGGMPRPIARRDPLALERLPMGGAPSFNPTIFGQPIPQGADFSNMPDFSQIDMSQLDLSGIPQSISQMNLPQMPEGLPSMEEIETAPRMPQMRMGDMQPRMMMAEGDEVFPDLTGDGKVTQADILKGRGVYAEGDEVKSFADYQPEGSLKGTFFDYIPDGYQVSSFLMDKFGQEAAQDPTIREMFEKEFKAARMAGKDVFEFMGKPYNTKTLEEVEGMRYGGEMERFQDGGEIDAMLSGMDSEEAGAMEDLEQMAPEMEMIDQLVMMVAQMIQQGAGEEEVIGFLREQGLDDEDIGTVLQLVAEMAETEEMAEDQIGNELEQLA
jgi:hypothetical protein